MPNNKNQWLRCIFIPTLVSSKNFVEQAGAATYLFFSHFSPCWPGRQIVL
jgi:hypothetical protein